MPTLVSTLSLYKLINCHDSLMSFIQLKARFDEGVILQMDPVVFSIDRMNIYMCVFMCLCTCVCVHLCACALVGVCTEARGGHWIPES